MEVKVNETDLAQIYDCPECKTGGTIKPGQVFECKSEKCPAGRNPPKPKPDSDHAPSTISFTLEARANEEAMQKLNNKARPRRPNYRIIDGLEKELASKAKYGNNWRLAALAGWSLFAYVLFLNAVKNGWVL
jgi:hypothetical protein